MTPELTMRYEVSAEGGVTGEQQVVKVENELMKQRVVEVAV